MYTHISVYVWNFGCLMLGAETLSPKPLGLLNCFFSKLLFMLVLGESI